MFIGKPAASAGTTVSKIGKIRATAAERRGKLLKTLVLKSRRIKNPQRSFSVRSEFEFC